MRQSIIALFVFVLAAFAGPAVAFESLKEPGRVAIMRHALAPGTGDPAGFRLDDCVTQRNLDERGRRQAREIGAALRSAGVVFDRVLTSQWCRCRETAALLGFGEPEDAPFLNSFFADRSTRDEQTAALRAFLAALDPGETVMLVTHQVNITALTGRGVGSGEVFVLAPGADGGVEVVEEIRAPL